jgi:hypothetical protein
VKRCQVNTIFHSTNNLVSNQHRLLEALATMHNAMAHRLNITDATNAIEASLGRCPASDEVDGCANVPK